MIYHIANDIIDLNCSENQKSFQNPKYIDKIMTLSEKKYFLENKSTFFPYLIWTCKESAYKIMLKTGNKEAFAPAKYKTNIKTTKANVILSTVEYQDKIIYSLSTINNDFIHTISSNTIIKNLIYKQIITKNQNRILIFSKLLNILPEKLSIIKENGIPYLFIDNKKSKFDISISHDGVFHAFVLLKGQ